ncbi:MAG: hypothetical protein KAH32_01950 [Chlamydiia bacterium]|nr:hypothetical protein [Chlamydiia bacterium]
MNNISRSCHTFALKGSSLRSAIVATIVASAIIIVCTVIKVAIPTSLIEKLKKYIGLRRNNSIGEESVNSTSRPARGWTDKLFGFLKRKYQGTMDGTDSSLTGSGQKKTDSLADDVYRTILPEGRSYKFPIYNQEFLDEVKSIMTCEKVMDNKGVGTGKADSINTDFSSKSIRSFPFYAEGQDFQAYYGNNPTDRLVLNNEMKSSSSIQAFIEDKSVEGREECMVRSPLKNIRIVKKMIFNSSNSQSNKSILIRRSPEMNIDKAIRSRGLLKDGVKCKKAAKSLAELAGKFIFIASGNLDKYNAICEKFNEVKSMFDSNNNIDISRYGLTAEKLLGKDYFTLSENSRGDVEVSVMSASSPEDCLPNSIFSSDTGKAFMLNYMIVLSVFPYNAEDMLKVIEIQEPHSLSVSDKSFLKKVAESAKNII